MKINGSFKKIIGMIIIIIFLVVNLLLLLSLVYSLVKVGDDPNIGTTMFSLIFPIVLFYFPLQYGIGLWRSGIADLLKIPNQSDMTIKTSRIQITFHDYRSLVLRLTFKNPIILYFFFLGLGLLIASLLNPTEKVLFGVVIGVVFISLPFIAFVQSKKNYNSNKNLKEIVAYEFNADNIIITGETFNSTLRWSSLYKVKELNDWILLYTDKIVAICIPKDGFNSENDLNTVRSFALNAYGVRKELKTH